MKLDPDQLNRLFQKWYGSGNMLKSVLLAESIANHYADAPTPWHVWEIAGGDLHACDNEDTISKKTDRILQGDLKPTFECGSEIALWFLYLLVPQNGPGGLITVIVNTPDPWIPDSVLISRPCDVNKLPQNLRSANPTFLLDLEKLVAEQD